MDILLQTMILRVYPDGVDADGRSNGKGKEFKASNNQHKGHGPGLLREQSPTANQGRKRHQDNDDGDDRSNKGDHPDEHPLFVDLGMVKDHWKHHRKYQGDDKHSQDQHESGYDIKNTENAFMGLHGVVWLIAFVNYKVEGICMPFICRVMTSGDFLPLGFVEFREMGVARQDRNNFSQIKPIGQGHAKLVDR